MTCISCGASNPDSVRFCGQCGRNLAAASQTDATIAIDSSGSAVAPAPAPRAWAETGVLSPPPIGSQSIAQGVGPLGPGASLTGLQPGTPFGRYRIEALLGEGGMGAVYRAHDAELGRTVALKLVRPEFATRPETMKRFKQELLLASKVSHKNILRIHDLGDLDGVKFITMALVEGSDLAALIERSGRLPVDRGVRFAKQLCAALEAAHAEGVVHRDLKPQNILIDSTDTAYVSDFGLAKSLEPEATVMTRTGQILGTPHYMSPEQVEAADVDHRSDLYSLGIIMYEMFTGKMPFPGESMMQLLYQRVNTPPTDPRQSRPDLPEYLANIILKCLERDSAKRYQNAREVLADLEAERSPAGVGLASASGARPAPAREAKQTISIQIPKPTRSTLWKAGVACALALAALLAVPGIRTRILHPAQSAKTDAGILHYLAVLPFSVIGDGQNSAYLADGVVDALSAKLAGLKSVYVAPSAAVAGQKEQNPQKLARALGVKLILRGTLTTGVNDSIAITVTLEDPANQGRPLLHQSFSGVRQDLLTLEDQIFNGVVNSLAIKESNEELARTTRRPTQNIEAYELYLKGRNAWRGAKTANDLQAAMSQYDQAIKLDPRFALAYAGLADTYKRMWDQTKDSVWTQRALGAAQQAQALDDNLPEAHYALGSIYTDTGKTEQAIAELHRALDLAPNSDEALRRLGTAYMKTGRQAESLTAYAKAAEVNPYLWTNLNRLGNAYFQAGRNAQALQAFQRVAELDPDRPEGWANMGAVYYRQGKWNECIPMFLKAIERQQKAGYYSNLGTTYFNLGRYDEAAAMFEKGVAMAPRDGAFRRNLADAYRWSGKKDQAARAYDDAISLTYELIQVNPSDAEALGTLASCYAAKGNSKQALEFIGRARAIDPKSNLLMYEEAEINVAAGQNAAALNSLEQALRNGYSLAEALADPVLKPLQATPEFSRLRGEFSK
ncbi:MAG TPA: tetratricopeptide repeat protein [Verrucomicrobiae bacterium]|nr:tetratricopeptide repeat protein [Verrucomicrobiae bacterium]